jgi:predicted nucleic acid-binding protein
MTGAALDTNVLQAILQAGHPLQERARQALKRAQKRKPFILCPVVFAEAHGIPGFDAEVFQAFLSDLGAEVDWQLPSAMWSLAGEAQVGYHQRRRKQNLTEQKRVLADFLIGAHAQVRNVPLVTLDPKGYRAAFPKLELISE